MPFTALILVIIAALFHATWNVAAKRSGGTVVFAFSTGVLTVLVWTPVIHISSFYFESLSVSHWGYTEWLSAFISASIHAVYYIILLKGYSVAPLSIVYPVARGSGPLVSSVVAIFVFNEVATVFSISGIALVISGIFLLTWPVNTSGIRDKSFKRGVKWGILTGVSIAAYTIVDSYGVKTLNMNPITFDYYANVLRVFILLPFVFTKLKEVKGIYQTNLKSMLIISLLSPLAYVLVLTAIQMAPVSHVAPARELSLMFGAFFGGKLLKEGHLLRRMTAAGIIAGGIILLTF